MQVRLRTEVRAMTDLEVNAVVMPQAVRERAGDGDVTVEPHPKLSNTVRVTVSNADMDATFHFQQSDLDTFLDLTFEEVAYGEEYLRYTDKWFAAESKRFWEQERAA